MTVIHCDLEGCGKKRGEQEFTPGWVAVERMEPSPILTGDDPGPWNFCSFEHLAPWAASVTHYD